MAKHYKATIESAVYHFVCPLVVSRSACFPSSSPMLSTIRLFSYFQHNVKNGIFQYSSPQRLVNLNIFFTDVSAIQIFCSLYCCSYPLLIFSYFFLDNVVALCNLDISFCNMQKNLSPLCSLL